MTAQATTTMSIETNAIAQILRALFRPSLLVHVGWGNGLGDITQWTAWQVPHAFVIEAEESKLAACQARALALAQANGQTTPSWQTIHATLAAQGGEQPYHVASNPSESGLLPTESLRHAWPHLQTVAKPTVVTRSLDELWQDIDAQLPLAANAQSTWLIIDCLPATDILAASLSALKSAQVVCARSLLSNRALLCDQMRAAGWTEVGWSESQHPAFGHAWFSRNIALELDQASQRQAQLTAERDALTKAKEAETQAKTALQTQLEALTKDRFELQAQLTQQIQSQDELQSELDKAIQRQAQLTAERDALAKAKEAETQAKTDLQTQLETLTKDRFELQAKLTQQIQSQDELQSELDKASQRQAQLTAERDALAKAKDAETASANKAKTDRDALAKEKQTLESKHKESQERLHQLESANQDLQNRQHLQHEELVKSEAQIELIKDLLLREQGI